MEHTQDIVTAELLPRPEHVSRRGVRHSMPCPMCHRQFDLFAAPWCGHPNGEPSKLCPHCDACSCLHPAYGDPNFWRDAPPSFRANGFERLFLLYL